LTEHKALSGDITGFTTGTPVPGQATS